MAITVNGQILRNLPEQVSKNTEDIIELQDTSENYGIRITALEQGAIALTTFQDCIFTGTSTFEGDINAQADLILSGDLSVGGNGTYTGSISAASASLGSLNATSIEASGTISANNFTEAFDKFLSPKNNYNLGYLDQDLTVSGLPTNLNCNYAHARVSNGKLCIVISFWAESGNAVSSSAGSTISYVPIPPVVMAKLFNYSGNYLAREQKTSAGGGTYSILLLVENGVFSIKLTNTNYTPSIADNVRFEFNFTL